MLAVLGQIIRFFKEINQKVEENRWEEETYGLLKT